MAHTLPALPYDYADLDDFVGAQTMEIHHSKHHNGYVTNLNAALEGLSDLADLSIEDLLGQIDSVPDEKKQAVINNGGGHANHSLFWEIIAPGGSGEPSAELVSDLVATFGSLDSARDQFGTAAGTRFGSGWAWLVVNSSGNLEIYSTANQDSPLMKGDTPIIGLDVREHAYYLKYQNLRPSYVSDFISFINWNKVNELYASAKS